MSYRIKFLIGAVTTALMWWTSEQFPPFHIGGRFETLASFVYTLMWLGGLIASIICFYAYGDANAPAGLTEERMAVVPVISPLAMWWLGTFGQMALSTSGEPANGSAVFLSVLAISLCIVLGILVFGDLVFGPEARKKN